jgi:hypothetical protein
MYSVFNQNMLNSQSNFLKMQYTILIYVKLLIILVIGILSLVTWVGMNDDFKP